MGGGNKSRINVTLEPQSRRWTAYTGLAFIRPNRRTNNVNPPLHWKYKAR
jgi:hypothetical protein